MKLFVNITERFQQTVHSYRRFERNSYFHTFSKSSDIGLPQQSHHSRFYLAL